MQTEESKSTKPFKSIDNLKEETVKGETIKGGTVRGTPGGGDDLDFPNDNIGADGTINVNDDGTVRVNDDGAIG